MVSIHTLEKHQLMLSMQWEYKEFRHTYGGSKISNSLAKPLVVDLGVLTNSSINFFSFDAFPPFSEWRLTHYHFIDNTAQTEPIRTEGVALSTNYFGSWNIFTKRGVELQFFDN